MKILLLVLALLLSSSSFSASSYFPSEIEENKKAYVTSLAINAEVFNLIQSYENGKIRYYLKDANREERITIYFYKDGSMFLKGGDSYGGWVRYSSISGYEFECNRTGGPTYAFNKTW